jgi:hypothetical protein
VDQASADQLADGALSRVVGITTLGVGVQDKDQLIGREPSRVFIEEKGQDCALGLAILGCGGARIARAAIRRVLVSHEEK